METQSVLCRKNTASLTTNFTPPYKTVAHTMRLTDTFYRSPTLWATDRHLKAQMIVRIFTTFPTFRMNETPHSNLLSGRTLNSPSLISSEEEKRESHPSPSPPRVRRISRYARIIFRIWTCQKFRYLAAGINEIGV